MKPIQAIIVLYRMSLADSPTYRTLQVAFQSDPSLREAIDLVVADNSTEAQALPDDFRGRYIHDGDNPGLARRYNQALALALEQGSTWLLLLDQDTTLTLDYLHEMTRRTAELEGDRSIAGIVPKLVQDGNVLSPHVPPRYRHVGFDRGATGRWPKPLYVFNSASAVRVSRVVEVGGFPEKFWLDLLDHATFHQLQNNGMRLFVMESTLEHELSANDAAIKDEASQGRYKNILNAEYDFYHQYGSLADQYYHRVRLLRGVLGALLKEGRPRVAMILLRVALRLG